MKIRKINFFVLFINVLIFGRRVYTDDDVVLNISDVTQDYVLFRMHQRYGPLTLGTLIPDVSMYITKVMDGASTIWTCREPDELLTLVRTYSLYNLNKLLYLYVVGLQDSYTAFYQKIDYDWHEIPEIEFDLKLLAIKRQRMFDLSGDDDDDTFYKQIIRLYGLPARIYIPYPRYDVITVVDDFEVIWEGDSIFDKCTSITIHGHPSNYKLIHLHLKISGGHDEIFFRKTGSEWIECTKNYFYEILRELDLEEESRLESDE